MTIQLEIENAKSAELLHFVESLRRLGVAISIKKIEGLVLPGGPVSDEALANLVSESEAQIARGESFSPSEIAQFMQAWRQR